MLTILLSFLILSGSGDYWQQNNCTCKKLITTSVSEEDDKRVEDYIYKELSGQITALGDSTLPIENILVEVYDHPEIALDPSISSSLSKKKIRQRKLASCKTRTDGMFCFKGIKSGKYEIRLTDLGGVFERLAGPWENRSWFITVDPRNSQSVKKLIEVYLDLRI